jgi:hypothetical protein
MITPKTANPASLSSIHCFASFNLSTNSPYFVLISSITPGKASNPACNFGIKKFAKSSI